MLELLHAPFMKYFIKLDDEIRGPFSVEHVRQRISERGYQSTDLVCAEGSEDWRMLGDLKEFADAFATQAPASNPMAVASLLFALATPLMLCLAIVLSEPILVLSYFIQGVCAIIFGHLALRKIGHSRRDMKGYRMAKTSLWLGYFMTLILPICAIPIIPLFARISEMGGITQSISYCKQITISLRLYASDHDGKYPDSIAPNVHSSNDAFRLLFKEGILETEKIFGCPNSPYKPDCNIGAPPDFLEAVKSGENHWAMTKGLSDAMDGSIPLVFENPSDASWPPKWNSSETKAKPGRVWTGGKIIIGFNDSSVEVLKLDSDKGENIGLKPNRDGTPIFPALDPKLEILNVAK